MAFTPDAASDGNHNLIDTISAYFNRSESERIEDRNKRKAARKIRRAARKVRRDARIKARASSNTNTAPVRQAPVVVEQPPSCSLKDSMIPKCYHKRDTATLNIALLYYGDHWKLSDLNRIEPILVERFYQATGKQVEVNIITKRVFSYKQKMPTDYSYNGITDKARLQRIWYSENVGNGIMNEVYSEYKKIASDTDMDKLDAILAITGAQFNGLGFVVDAYL